MSFYPSNLTTLRPAIRGWLQRRNLSIPEFARQMGYSYNHAYQMLNGVADVSEAAIGRIAIVYGAEAIREIAEIASEDPQG